jgi:NAD(P)-dependent dehydrogenase (short-subunit alcohol dehydrogenase family)
VIAPGDISDEAHCQSLVERAIAELGTLDILVNNAAYQVTREGIEQIPEGEWEHTFKTNVCCPQYCPGRAPEMERPGSRHASG